MLKTFFQIWPIAGGVQEDVDDHTIPVYTAIAAPPFFESPGGPSNDPTRRGREVCQLPAERGSLLGCSIEILRDLITYIHSWVLCKAGFLLLLLFFNKSAIVIRLLEQ